MSENILDRIKLLMNYKLNETYEENKKRILNEQETTLSYAEIQNIADDLNYYLNGDVESEDLEKINDILNEKLIGKKVKGGGCALSKAIAYYQKIAGKVDWSIMLGTLPFDMANRSDFLKDIRDSQESGEAGFEDIKQDLINLIQTELDGFCNTASSQQQTTTPTPSSGSTTPAAGSTTPAAGSTTKKVRQVPPELRNVDGVKLFQSWLDQNHAGWHDKYNVLGDDVNKGWGIYGPRTEKAWTNYKDDYLKWINDGGSFEKLKSQDTIKTGSETEYKYKPPINFPEKLTFDNSNSILNKKNLTP